MKLSQSVENIIQRSQNKNFQNSCLELLGLNQSDLEKESIITTKLKEMILQTLPKEERKEQKQDQNENIIDSELPQKKS